MTSSIAGDWVDLRGRYRRALAASTEAAGNLPLDEKFITPTIPLFHKPKENPPKQAGVFAFPSFSSGVATAVILRDQIIPLLLSACPSFQTAWDEHRQVQGSDLVYVALGDLARELLRLHLENRTEDFPAVAQVIERLHLEGDAFVREAATIGCLEAIQNIWEHAGVDPELFGVHLLPVSQQWWESLNDFWSGKVKYVGEGLKPPAKAT